MKPALTRPALVLVVAAGCFGCGGQNVFFTCPSSRFQMVSSDQPLDCQKFAHNEEAAFSLLAQRGIVPESSWHDYQRVSVLYQFSWLVHARPGCVACGVVPRDIDLYEPNSITISSGGEALLHSMLHHWDYIHGRVDTMFHPSWCEKGYGQVDSCPGSADDVYQKTMVEDLTEPDGGR